MGIDGLIILGVLVVIGGMGIYFYTRSHNTDDMQDQRLSTPPGAGGSTPSESDKRKREKSAPPAQQSPGSISPDADDRSTLTGGGQIDWETIQNEIKRQADHDDDDDDVDEFMEEAEEEVPRLEPAIDDTQTMRAITKEDTQEMMELLQEAPQEMLPEEIKGWMDDLATEKAKMEGGEVDDLDPQSEIEDGVLDIDYPAREDQAPPKPSKPIGESTSDDTPSATTAHFSAFYPREAEAGKRYGVYIYAHAESLLEQITSDAAKFKQELGGNVPQPRTAKDSKALAHGTKITVALESEEVEFEPDILTKRWHGDWTRYEFEFRPKAELIDETIFVRASIMVLGFEIAKIKFAMDVTPPHMQVMSRSPEAEVPDNPFARAKLESTTAIKYDKIFISYSRKDKVVAEAFKVIQEAAGNDVFFDVDDIRTGEDWQVAIARAIDEADYLQLFWSEHSANSEWCGYEWDYALNYRCQENKCREFIRPVWWTAPMPPPPDSLSHLNFRRFDFEALMKHD